MLRNASKKSMRTVVGTSGNLGFDSPSLCSSWRRFGNSSAALEFPRRSNRCASSRLLDSDPESEDLFAKELNSKRRIDASWTDR